MTQLMPELFFFWMNFFSMNGRMILRGVESVASLSSISLRTRTLRCILGRRESFRCFSAASAHPPPPPQESEKSEVDSSENRPGGLSPFSRSVFDPPSEFSTDSLPLTPNGDILLYESNQRIVIRLMAAVGSINAFYWTYTVANYLLYKDVIINGIEMGGNPLWSYVGLACTGLIGFATKTYAHNSILKVYQPKNDSLRLGFQFHNVLGSPGRKIEVQPKNIETLSPTKSFFSNVTPLKITGLPRNVIIDNGGRFYGSGLLKKIFESKGNINILVKNSEEGVKDSPVLFKAPSDTAAGKVQESTTSAGKTIDFDIQVNTVDVNSKEYRMNMIKEAARKRKNKK